jgi:hypothetical protein
MSRGELIWIQKTLLKKGHNGQSKLRLTINGKHAIGS